MARVINNTVLSNFSMVGRLDILRELFCKVYLTHEVREEVLRGIEEGYTFLERAEIEIGIGKDAWLELLSVETYNEIIYKQANKMTLIISGLIKVPSIK